MIKNVQQISFGGIFWFAEKQYGILWNPCNDLFFRKGVLRYNSVTDFCVIEWPVNCSFFTDWEEMEDIKASSFTKEEVLAMNDRDKAIVIIAAYLEYLGFVGDDIQIDCR